MTTEITIDTLPEEKTNPKESAQTTIAEVKQVTQPEVKVEAKE